MSKVCGAGVSLVTLVVIGAIYTSTAYAAVPVSVGTASVPVAGTSAATNRHALATLNSATPITIGTGAIAHGTALAPPKPPAPVAAGTAAAPSVGVNVPTPPVAAAAAVPKSPPPVPPPSTTKVFKHGECPLTRDSSGVWRGPDGNVVDAAVAKMGDCK